MRKIFVQILIILGVIVLAGFILGAFIGEHVTSCTELDCSCRGQTEISCNSCEMKNPLFISGFVNVNKLCKGKEILTCQDGTPVKRRFENLGECRNTLAFFELVLEYIE